LVELEGRADLGDAVTSASGDFNDLVRYPEGVSKNVLILTAGKNTCTKGYVGEIERRLKEMGEDLDVNFHFFGLDVPAREERRLRGLGRDFPSVTTRFSDNPKGLARDLDDAGKDIGDGVVVTETPTPTPTESTESTESTPQEAPEPQSPATQTSEAQAPETQEGA
jgi:hypothetical protein